MPAELDAGVQRGRVDAAGGLQREPGAAGAVGSDRDATLKALARKEAPTGVFKQIRSDAVCTLDGPVPGGAVVFVVDEEHPQYAAGLTAEETAEHVASASGRHGSNFDFLEEVNRQLQASGISDKLLLDTQVAARARRLL